MEKNQVREYLSQLDTPKLKGLDGTHPQVVRKLAVVSVRSLSKTFQWSQQQGEMPKIRRKARIAPVLKEAAGNYRPVNLGLIPRKVMAQLILETISRLIGNNKKIISQHRFTKGKSRLTNVINLCDEITSLM